MRIYVGVVQSIDLPTYTVLSSRMIKFVEFDNCTYLSSIYNTCHKLWKQETKHPIKSHLTSFLRLRGSRLESHKKSQRNIRPHKRYIIRRKFSFKGLNRISVKRVQKTLEITIFEDIKVVSEGNRGSKVYICRNVQKLKNISNEVMGKDVVGQFFSPY